MGKTKKIVEQAEKMYQLAHDISISIKEFETLFECLEATSSNVFKVNHNKGILWLEELEQLVINKQPKYINHKLESIRDIYMEQGYTSKADYLTNKNELDAYKIEPYYDNEKRYLSMSEYWSELMIEANSWIGKESFKIVCQVFLEAQKGDYKAAQLALPIALKTIKDKCKVEIQMHHYYLFYHYGIFLLNNDLVEEGREVLEQAIHWAKKKDDLCSINSYISWVADVFCYKQLYADVVRIMSHISDGERNSQCATHPFNFDVVLYEIQEGNLQGALEFARQINLNGERYCALDDVLSTYANRCDIGNYLMVTNEFDSRENLCFSIAYSLTYIAKYIIDNQKVIENEQFEAMLKQLKVHLLGKPI